MWHSKGRSFGSALLNALKPSRTAGLIRGIGNASIVAACAPVPQ